MTLDDRIPEGWLVKQVSDVLDFRSGNVDPQNHLDETFELYSMPAYDETGKPEITQGKTIGSSKKEVFAGDVLFARLNPRIPRIWVVEDLMTTYRKLASTDFVVLVDKNRENNTPWFDAQFLKYQLLSPQFRSQVTKGVQGATGSRQRIRMEHLEAAKLTIPSVETQQRIVARIEALLAEVREMRKLQGEITADCNKFIDAVLAETFSPAEMAKWPNKEPLDKLAEITARQVDPTLPEYRDMPHIYGATIEEGTGRLLAYNTAAEDGMTSGKYHFRAGAVLYSKIRPYLRKATIVDFDGLCSADMYPLQLKTNDLLPGFLMWSLLSPAFTSYANNLSGRARIPKLNREQLFNYEMPYPAKDTQERICELLRLTREEVGEMREINKRDRQFLDQLEQAILSQAFRGEL